MQKWPQAPWCLTWWCRSVMRWTSASMLLGLILCGDALTRCICWLKQCVTRMIWNNSIFGHSLHYDAKNLSVLALECVFRCYNIIILGALVLEFLRHMCYGLDFLSFSADLGYATKLSYLSFFFQRLWFYDSLI